MTDNSVYNFLAARRKFIAGLLAIVGVIAVSGLVPEDSVRLVIQGIVGVLGVYGIHEVPNDSQDTGAHAA